MKNVKKIFAIAATTAMLGATASFAAADLSDYPMPFVNEDGVLNAAIVVGANAATADVLGSIDIAASLQSMAVTETAIAGSSEVAVEGAEDFDNLFLGNTALDYNVELDSSDLTGFVDSDFDQDGTEVDYNDYIVLQQGALDFIGAHPITDYTDTENFGENVMMRVQTPTDIQYIVEIEDDINWTNLNDVDGKDDDIEFMMLGTTVKITGTTFVAGAGEITIESAAEYALEDGDSVTVDGHEITLVTADDNSALVEVDGEVQEIQEGEDERFSAGIEVLVDTTFYREGSETGSAVLKIGEAVSETVKTGDAATIFGQVDDDNDAEWIWNVTLNEQDSGNPSYIGLTYNQAREEVASELEDEYDLPALMLGESIDLPNNYAMISFESLNEDPTAFTMVSATVDSDYDLAEDDGREQDDSWGIQFSTPGDDGENFIIGTNTKASDVWVVYNASDALGQVWYEDNGDETFAGATGSTTVKLELDDEEITIVSPANISDSTEFSFQFDSGAENVTLNASYSTTEEGWGSDVDESDSEDLLYNGNEIGAKDPEEGIVMINYGAWFEAPEDLMEGTTFELYVPDEKQYATVVVKTTGSSVSAGSAGGVSYSVNPTGLGLGVLDTDAPALGSKPMIVVGGPAVNSVAADLMGQPTTEELLETFSAGKAIIRWYDEDQALLVAGWEALETQGASNVVADYENYDFEGEELEVLVTDLNSITVNPVN
jgi:hypothetical protein